MEWVDSSLKKRRWTTRNVGGSGKWAWVVCWPRGRLCAQAARRLVPPRYLHVVGVRNFISTNFSHSIVQVGYYQSSTNPKLRCSEIKGAKWIVAQSILWKLKRQRLKQRLQNDNRQKVVLFLLLAQKMCHLGAIYHVDEYLPHNPQSNVEYQSEWPSPKFDSITD